HARAARARLSRRRRRQCLLPAAGHAVLRTGEGAAGRQDALAGQRRPGDDVPRYVQLGLLPHDPQPATRAGLHRTAGRSAPVLALPAGTAAAGAPLGSAAMARKQLPHGSGARMTPLPPAAAVQAALRTTTERLAAEVASPRPAAPAWTHFEWRIARAVAVMHGVSGLLSARLAWHGPPGWMDFLREQHAHTAARQVRLIELRERVNAAFAEDAIPAQALKGAVLDAIFYRPGERPMADLDVLVPLPHAERA